MAAGNVLGTLTQTKASDGSVPRISDRMLLLGAAIIVIGVIVWLTPIVLAYFEGASVTKKVRNNSDRAGLFIVHVITGTIAVLLGSLQMYAPFRSAYPQLHSWLGRSYVLFVMISAGTSLGLSPRLSTYGTDILRPLAAVMWAAFTIIAVIAIRNADINKHRRWMTRSYALAYMGLTFLAFSAIRKMSGIPLEYGYPLVIWLSFVVNVSVAEWVVRRSNFQLPKRHVRNFGDHTAPELIAAVGKSYLNPSR